MFDDGIPRSVSHNVIRRHDLLFPQRRTQMAVSSILFMHSSSIQDLLTSVNKVLFSIRKERVPFLSLRWLSMLARKNALKADHLTSPSPTSVPFYSLFCILSTSASTSRHLKPQKPIHQSGECDIPSMKIVIPPTFLPLCPPPALNHPAPA